MGSVVRLDPITRTRALDAFFNIVLPIFAIIGVGYACGWLKLLGEASSEALNGFVYWVALPALMFQAMAGVDLAELYNPNFIAAFLLASVATGVLAGIVGRLLFRLTVAEASLHGLNAGYPNTGYMGIPLAIAAFGEEAALPAIVAATITVLTISLAIIPIEMSRQGRGQMGKVIGRILKALVTNPMIVAPVLGLVWAGSGLEMAKPIARMTELLGGSAGPCALMAIGLFMVGKPITDGSWEVGVMTFAKLIMQPLFTAVAVLIMFPTDPLWAAVAILLAALPIGSGPFVLAQAQGIYVRRTSTVMLVTTVLSIATVSAFLVVFPLPV